MSKTLMGALVMEDAISATYSISVFGGSDVATKTSDWSEAVIDAAASLVAACQKEASGMGTVTGAQVYTPITDPYGAPPYSAPGEVVDVYFGPTTSIRCGSSAPVPASIATARDAFKAAVQADL